MKYVLALLAVTLFCKVALAKPLKPTRVEPELGASLGFQIYRFEAKLAGNEVLVIRERTENEGKIFESEYAAVGDSSFTKYEIVLVDSGAFHPSLVNTYMLRYPNSGGFIEKKRLLQSSQTMDTIEFIFSDPDRNEPVRKQSWTGSVEKYTDVVKRWPDLPQPRPGFGSGSRRSVSTK